MFEAIQQFFGGSPQLQLSLPWLLFALVSIPMIVIAWGFRTYPSWWWVALISCSLVMSLVAIFVPVVIVIAVLVDLFLLVVAATDLVWSSLLTRQGIKVRRKISRTCSLGVPFVGEVQIENRTRAKLFGTVRDDLPDHFEAVPESHSLRLNSLDQVTLQRRMTPKRRGAFLMDRCDLVLQSPMRLWNRYLTFSVKDELNVYPNLKQLSDYALLAKTDRLSLIGVRKKRLIGQDNEFERLRDYTRDDNYRHIDWRSTARRGRLTVKQFQSEQSQRIMFLLDCGRMMVNQHNGMSLLDHSFNSILMMAYVALAQGDAVGMLCFSDQIHSYLPPRSGSSQLNRLIHAGFDQFPRMVESRYDQAFLYLANHCKRRSMVVLATNVIDEVNSQSVVDHLGKIKGPHLPVGVLMRDRTMYEAVENEASEDYCIYRAAAAADVLLWRQQVLSDLSHRGVLIVDAFPDELAAPLVNQYLEVKAKHLL
jgi:uncharacterized protein (DUF58 family)